MYIGVLNVLAVCGD